jgi:two-component system response regulator VicR
MATRILLVEDDPNLGQILKEYLDLKGYQATLARDGEQGFQSSGSSPMTCAFST